MNTNEYINGMADLIRATGADVRVEDIDGKKRIAARFPSVDAMRSEMKKAFTANMETLQNLNAGLKALRASGEIKSATQGYAPLVLEHAGDLSRARGLAQYVEYRMDFGF